MNKLKFQEKPLKNTVFSFEGQDIEVIPHIPHSVQQMLINSYLDSYFENGKEDRLGAELINKVAFLDLFTNIDINDSEGSDLMNLIDSVTSSGLWEKIEKAIKNYRTYEYSLNVAIESKRKEGSDIAHVLKSFLNDKVSPLIEKFQSMDMSDEKLAEVKSIVGDLGSQLKDTPVGNLIQKGTV